MISIPLLFIAGLLIKRKRQCSFKCLFMRVIETLPIEVVLLIELFLLFLLFTLPHWLIALDWLSILQISFYTFTRMPYAISLSRSLLLTVSLQTLTILSPPIYRLVIFSNQLLLILLFMSQILWNGLYPLISLLQLLLLKQVNLIV